MTLGTDSTGIGTVGIGAKTTHLYTTITELSEDGWMDGHTFLN